MNKSAGFSLIAKPCYRLHEDDDNVYAADAVCLCLLPKVVADRADNYNGDPMISALVECVEAGVQVRLN